MTNHTLLAWPRLIRLWNVLLSGAAAVVGAYLTSGRIDMSAWLLISLAPMLITAAGNIQNDLDDLEIDRLNRPDRPLVTNAIRPAHAKSIMVLFYFAGLVTAGILGWIPLIIATMVVVLLNLYNASWSRLPGIGNLAVSLMGALPVIYGGVSIEAASPTRFMVEPLLVPFSAAVIAFWLHLSRELLKDTVDIDGDRASGRRTLPILYGCVAAMRIGALAMLMAAAASLWLGTTGLLGPLYLFGICVTVLPALLLGAAQCWWRPFTPIASLWAGWLKVIMLAGLVWMLLGIRPS
jgi:geranylgeranylglycerol-phosphate geranylgeranyltransferase